MVEFPRDLHRLGAGRAHKMSGADKRVCGALAEVILFVFSYEQRDVGSALLIPHARGRMRANPGLRFPVEERGRERKVSVKRVRRVVGLGLYERHHERIRVGAQAILDALANASGSLPLKFKAEAEAGKQLLANVLRTNFERGIEPEFARGGFVQPLRTIAGCPEELRNLIDEAGRRPQHLEGVVD